MKIQVPSVSVVLFKIRWYARWPGTWFAIGLTALTLAGQQLGIQYLTYPYTIMFIAMIPAVGGLAIGPKFAMLYFRLHRNINRILPWNKGKEFEYFFSEQYAEAKPGLLTLLIGH